MITYYRGDERPAWQATCPVNGVTEDLSSGYTFSVTLATFDAPTTAVLTKTTNITGASGSVITVAWAAGELDLTPGAYVAELRVRRTSDSTDFTIGETIQILAKAA